MIALIDYGVGNIRNVYRALTEIGMPVEITRDPAAVRRSEAIILPGVGAYRDAMENLRATGLIPCLAESVQQGKWLLGICLGMQLLFEGSDEGGDYAGLGWLPGRIVRLETALKIPHMGWNQLELTRPDPVTANLGEHPSVYFVHSYCLKTQDPDLVLATADYDGPVPAIVRRGSVLGMQFHPEKSGAVGLQLLKNFKEMIR